MHNKTQQIQYIEPIRMQTPIPVYEVYIKVLYYYVSCIMYNVLLAEVGDTVDIHWYYFMSMFVLQQCLFLGCLCFIDFAFFRTYCQYLFLSLSLYVYIYTHIYLFSCIDPVLYLIQKDDALHPIVCAELVLVEIVQCSVSFAIT